MVLQITPDQGRPLRAEPGTRLLYIANVAWFFRSHRLPIALEAIRRNYDVHLAASFANDSERRSFREMGITTHDVPFERSGTDAFAEVGVIARLRRLLKALRPAICHNVSIKPIIYGGALQRLQGIPAVHAISGLGYSYIAKGYLAQARRLLLNSAYAFAVNGARSRVIVQNDDDLTFFRSRIGVHDHRLVLIRGSGVDPQMFNVSLPSSEPPIVVLIARMLADKVVREFAAAAGRLRASGTSARFVLVGDVDPHNRTGLRRSEIDQLVAEAGVEYWGHRNDIPAVLAAARIVCLPSYREGFPKSLLEAAAAGRAIVATDVPGCREIVKHGENGLLVPAQETTALANALGELLSDPSRCAVMGRMGRRMVEENFSINIVVRKTMQLYEGLLQ